MKKVFLILVIFLLKCLTSSAQRERLFTVNAELPNSLITALAQDSIGNIWIGTENGLCRYDGAKFTTYTHNAKDTTSLASNRISDIYVTSLSQVLVGSQGGLQIYDQGYDNFKNIPLQPLGVEPKETSAIHVGAIKALANGDLLLGTLGNGLLLVKVGTTELSHSKQDSLNPQELNNSNPECWVGIPATGNTHSSKMLRLLDVNPDNSIWTGAALEGAWYGKWGKDGLLNLKLVPGSENWRIEDVVSDKEGNAYYATQDGVYKVSAKDLTPTLEAEYRKEKTLSLLLVSDKTLLLGTEGSGVIGYDLENKRFTETGYNTSGTDISQSKVRDLLIDRNNNLWVGMYQKGVLACQGLSSQFDYIGKGSSTADLIGSNPVMALYVSDQGALWVATDNDGLYCITTEGVSHFPQGEKGLPPLISNIFQASDGTLWVESIDTGMATLDPRSGTFRYADDFKGMSVFDIEEDAQGRLWVATMGEGLFCCDPQGRILYKAPFTEQSHYTPGSDLLHNTWINSLSLSPKKDKLFINTCYGVGCYDFELGSYVNTFGENRILPGQMCYDSYQDPDGNLWIATTNGLYRWHADESEIAHYDTDNGLTDNTIVGITADEKGNLWLATYYGLSKFDTNTGTFSNYYVQDGIQGNEFSLRSMHRSADGKIYAGGLNGITVFDAVELPGKSPQIRIADVYLNDKKVTLASESNGEPIIRITENNKERTVYQFDISDNSIGVELTTDQFNNNNIRYQYRIDRGLWSSLQQGANKVYFSNLSAGKHIIEFKAVAVGKESEITPLEIHIRQHWYLRWWVIMIYCLAAGLIAYVIYRSFRNRRRMEALILQQQKKEEFNEQTMQFLVNIAHEIRSPISLITNPINELSQSHKDPRSRHLFSIVRNNINRMMLLADQLLDVRKIDHNQLRLNKVTTDMGTYVADVMSLFQDMAQRKGINMKLETQANAQKVYADIDPKEFDKVIANLLSNALKFTETGGHVVVSLSENDTNNSIILKVTDDGPGITQEHLPHIFERFYQASESQNKAHHGSGVGLHLTSLLVQKHGGKISAVNNPDGKGVTFTVEIPTSTAAQDLPKVTDTMETSTTTNTKETSVKKENIGVIETPSSTQSAEILGNETLTVESPVEPKEKESSTMDINTSDVNTNDSSEKDSDGGVKTNNSESRTSQSTEIIENLAISENSTEAQSEATTRDGKMDKEGINAQLSPYVFLSHESEYELESTTLKSKPTLIIIEDNREIRNYLHEQLQRIYNVVTFDNAKDALHSMLEKKPDIVITDIVLPGMDGISLIKSIRQNININDLPIIVLSAKSDEADIAQAIQSGADYYVTKPFNLRLLNSYLRNLLSQRQRLKVIYKGDQIESDIPMETALPKSPDKQFMEKLTKAVAANISNPEYSVEDMASEVCMSRVHLNRKLKQLTNQSPSTYLRNVRLTKAAEMLRKSPAVSVGDVALSVGMTSMSHFSHAFKELFGCSPSEYTSRNSALGSDLSKSD